MTAGKVSISSFISTGVSSSVSNSGPASRFCLPDCSKSLIVPILAKAGHPGNDLERTTNEI